MSSIGNNDETGKGCFTQAELSTLFDAIRDAMILFGLECRVVPFVLLYKLMIPSGLLG